MTDPTPLPVKPPIDSDLPADHRVIRDLVDIGAATKVIPLTASTSADGYLAVVPDGYELTVRYPELQAMAAAPRRVKGTATVTDTISWLAYFGKHGGDQSEVFGDVKAGTITALLNAPTGPGEPAWGDHRLVLQLEHSPAWQAWTRITGRLLGQTEFAEHIEDRAPDLIEPDAASMLEIAQSIKATSTVKFQGTSRLHDGTRSFQYLEEIDGRAGNRGQLDIPTEVKLRLPAWRGVAIVVEPTARFRYRITDRGMQMGVVLDRIDDLLDAAWRSLLGELTDTLPVPVLAGRAPSYGG